MMVLSRKLGEKVYVGADVCITVVDIDRGKIRIGIDCPKYLQIVRQELLPNPWPAPSPGQNEIADLRARLAAAYERIGKQSDLLTRRAEHKRTWVTLCGSTRFSVAYREANLRETLAGRIVLSVGCDLRSDHELWPDKATRERVKAELDALHLDKISASDEVLVLNCLLPWCPNCSAWCNPLYSFTDQKIRSRCCDVEVEQRGYVGDSTSREIAFARSLGKVVRFLEPESA